jgi:hypothetical protein
LRVQRKPLPDAPEAVAFDRFGMAETGFDPGFIIGMAVEPPVVNTLSIWSKRSPATLTVSAILARIDCRSWLIATARSAVDIAFKPSRRHPRAR